MPENTKKPSSPENLTPKSIATLWEEYRREFGDLPNPLDVYHLKHAFYYALYALLQEWPWSKMLALPLAQTRPLLVQLEAWAREISTGTLDLSHDLHRLTEEKAHIPKISQN